MSPEAQAPKGEYQDEIPLFTEDIAPGSWRIHTGPFPLITPRRAEQMWLWRITNGLHYTAIIVRLAESVLLPREELSASVADAVATRGLNAIRATLTWSEPPREITFDDPVGRSTSWGGCP